MKKTLKLISALLAFALVFQICIPFSVLANDDINLKEINYESNLSDEELQLGLYLISENQDLFLMDINQEFLGSYNNEDLNFLLLKYSTFAE